MEAPRRDEAGRARLETLGRAAGALLDDLSDEVAALGARARLAAGEARLGRLPTGEVERIAAAAAELERMVRDAREVAFGAALSPEVAFDLRAETERGLRRLLPALPAVELRLDAPLPAGTEVPGRASLFHRVLARLVRAAAGRARAGVRVQVVVEPAPRTPGGMRALVAVEDDGPAPAGGATLASFAEGEGVRLDAALWAGEGLGGSLRLARGEALGGARLELRLPVAPRLAGAAPALLGRRLVLLEPPGPDALEPALRAAGAEVSALPADVHEARLVRLVVDARPHALVLDAGFAEERGLHLWQALALLAPPLAARTVFVTGRGEAAALEGTLGATGCPLLVRPVEVRELRRAIAALG